MSQTLPLYKSTSQIYFCCGHFHGSWGNGKNGEFRAKVIFSALKMVTKTNDFWKFLTSFRKKRHIKTYSGAKHISPGECPSRTLISRFGLSIIYSR